MEGGGECGYVYAHGNNLPLHDLSMVYQRPKAPPLSSSIDRFLLGQTSNIYSLQHQVQENLDSSTGFVVDPGCAMDHAFNGHEDDQLIIPWPTLHAITFVDDTVLSDHRSTTMLPNDKDDSSSFKFKPRCTTTRLGKTARGDHEPSMVLIKGPWSEEEDRNLIKLVEQYGVRKWAQIASKLDGRAGKQCRERWNNHLRPDIKKDSWSEEEERLLIEAHEQCGNKWAEIAKKIPGRTENSVKNHWNATKRRQNARRKNKKAETQTRTGNKQAQSSILLNYIKSKDPESRPLKISTLSDDGVMRHEQCYYGTQMFLPELLDYESSSPLLDIDTCHQDELLFMQNLFNDKASSCDHHGDTYSILHPLDDQWSNVSNYRNCSGLYCYNDIKIDGGLTNQLMN
ncbi:hypothetical protein Dimus_012513 [Dionaea muscipula]